MEITIEKEVKVCDILFRPVTVGCKGYRRRPEDVGDACSLACSNRIKEVAAGQGSQP